MITKESSQLGDSRSQLAVDVDAHSTETARLASLAVTIAERKKALNACQQTLTTWARSSCAAMIAQITGDRSRAHGTRTRPP